MATRFVRIDLSDVARDFRPLAVEPGVPMLDRSGAVSKILFRWLGGLIAEPVWEDESVNFFVRDDHGGRLEEATMQSISPGDLTGLLKNDVAMLESRLEKAQPETSTERAVRKITLQTFRELALNPTRSDLDSYFFKYRDVQGSWRLVWCWGYQRFEQTPAPAVICQDPACRQLFLRRPGKPKCPGCEKAIMPKPRKRSKWPRRLALLLLLLLLAWLGWWLWEHRGGRLTAEPKDLAMVVGEITDLKVTTASKAPITFVTSDPGTLEITPANRLVGRKDGTATVEVSQGDEKCTVNVKITPATFSSIAMDPAKLVVPVDDAIRPKVMAKIEGDASGRNVEIAPDLLSCEKRPSPRYAEFDEHAMELRGVKPTEPKSPQMLVLQLQKHLAKAPVEVIVPALQLEITPAGPVDLPLGQQMRLQAWAKYENGHRVQVMADRLQWHVDPKPAAKSLGLELRGDRVAALKPKVGPLTVWATYYGHDSNHVAFKSVEAGPVTLQATTDRTLRLTGETGRVVLGGTTPNGDVELVPELAAFQTSDAKTLNIDEKTGAFRAAAPGAATVTASHLAAKQPATLKLSVHDPAKAKLVFDPAAVKVAVDERATLPLYLEVNDGPKPERAALEGPGVGYSVAKPQAVRWQPPSLVGLSPAPPFELTASFAPYLKGTATARVEVASAVEPAAIRVVPGEVAMAPGQTLPLRVEEQLPGGNEWKEVRPDAVVWKVPAGLTWSPATESLAAAASVPPGASGEFALQAEYRGKQAAGRINVKPEGPNPADAAARVYLAREPGGDYVPVGRQQRYAVMVEKEGKAEPAASVRWPDDFENEYVRWQAPVLTAKKPGYEQWLRADVAGRTALVHASTYEPGQFALAPPRTDAPVAVRIVSDQGPAVKFPVGAEFNDFRVEAEYPDGFTRVVTKKATITTPEPPQTALLTATNGRLIGVRPGQTNVQAEFDGVHSQQPLGAEVLASLDVDEIRLTPAPVTIQTRETFALDAVGYKGGKSVGIITGAGKLDWQSGNEKVVHASGPAVTGVGLGQAPVTARLGQVTSQPAQISVVDSIATALSIEPKVIRLRVGEAARIGADVSILRGDLDLSRQCRVTSALPSVVKYLPETHSILGVSPGASAVAFTWGDKLANVMVEVMPGGQIIDGTVVVEPSAGTLAPGQALDLRVFVVGRDGTRLDRTESAVFSSSDQAKVAIQGNRACALAPGSASITASLPGVAKPGSAFVTVNNEEIQELVADPAANMSVGDRTRLRILGRAACGTHEMFPQADLAVTAGGANPAAIKVTGPTEITGAAAGQAVASVDWRKKVKCNVPVTVGNDAITDLKIEPPESTIHPGEGLTYQVTGLRGGQRRVYGPEDGVQIFTSDANVARVIAGTSVGGLNPGRTAVVAQVGNQRAEAGLSVTGSEGDIVTTGLGGRVVTGTGGTVVGPGYGYSERWVGGGRGWRGGGYGGTRVVGDGGDVVVAPAANVSGLRFVPDVLRLPTDSPGAGVRVIEVLADGSLGRDVTTDPGLELTEPTDIVKVEKSADGPVFKPVKNGETRIGAKLGTLTADPLLVQVGEVLAGTGRLEVTPDPLVLWSGETGQFAGVRLAGGPGQPGVDIDYTVTAADNQGIVKVDGGKQIKAQSNGTTQVVITAADPAGGPGKVTANATVQVVTPDRLTIEPGKVSLQVGESTPPLAVMAQPADGPAYQVPATLESVDPNILAPDPENPAKFVAKTLGSTQIKALYRGRDVVAAVDVGGKRFEKVDPTLNEGDSDFDVTVKVQAAASEGELEYRIYAPGQPPAETWVPTEQAGDGRQVELRSPRMAFGPRGTRYQLMIEARPKSGGPAQQYPLTFQLKARIEETK